MPRPTQVASPFQPRFPYGPLTLCGPTFQTVPVPGWLLLDAPTTPAAPRRRRFRLLPFRSPLLRESIFLSSPAGTKMFQFPAFAALARCTHFMRAGSPIRTPPDLFPFADPRSFSQLTTSFLASGSLGIPRSPFSSFSRVNRHSLSFLAYSSFLKLQSPHNSEPIRLDSKLYTDHSNFYLSLPRFSLSIVNELRYPPKGIAKVDIIFGSANFFQIF